MVRADRDRWDLATSVGATATMVAAQRALAADPRYALIDDPYAAPLVRAVGMDVYTRLVDWQIPVEGIPSSIRSEWPRGWPAAPGSSISSSLMPPTVASASSSSWRPGWTPGLHLAWPVGGIVYEVDMPEVIEFKTATLSDLGAEPATERRTVAVDLRDDWATALQTAGFDPKVPAAWSAEGLLVYLPVEAQDALFDNITALSAPGSRLAFEFVPDTAIFADERWRNYHNRMSELGFDIDLNELVYHGQRGHVLDYLTRDGWQTSALTVTWLYEANGFAYPDDELATAFADLTYSSATLMR